MADEKLVSPREAAILAILINGERYGREIRNDYEERTGKGLPLGALYVTLDRMEQDGLVKPRLGESGGARGDNRKKYFEITGLGERALSAFEAYVIGAHGGRLAWKA